MSTMQQLLNAAHNERRVRELERLLDGALQFAFRVGPKLEETLGAGPLGGTTMTQDGKGVTVTNDRYVVTLVPSTERIKIVGHGTNIGCEVHAEAGQLDGQDVKEILATRARIEAVNNKLPDPYTDGIDLLESPVTASA